MDPRYVALFIGLDLLQSTILALIFASVALQSSSSYTVQASEWSGAAGYILAIDIAIAIIAFVYLIVARKLALKEASRCMLFELAFIAIFMLCLLLITAAAQVLIYSDIIPQAQALSSYDAATSLSFSSSVFVYMLLFKRKNLRMEIGSLGIGRSRFTVQNVGIGLLLFFIFLLVELGVSLFSIATGTQINTNVGLVLAGAPLWFYVFSAVIAPVNEEIFFRGFLVPRAGILISAVIFGLGHATYDSTFAIEVIAALAFGLLSGYVFRKTKSIYPSLLAHVLINSLAVLAFVR